MKGKMVHSAGALAQWCHRPYVPEDVKYWGYRVWEMGARHVIKNVPLTLGLINRESVRALLEGSTGT